LAPFLHGYSQVLLQALRAMFFLSDSIRADGFHHNRVSAMKKPLLHIFFAFALSTSLAASAQSLPQFGTARFGQAIFGQASAAALPVPFMPLWATITLAVLLWAVVYLMRAKEA
jgi:hypothetical protein